MPKKARKSLGRKFKGSRETIQSSRSQEDGPLSNEAIVDSQHLEDVPMETSTCDNEMEEVTNVRIYEHSSLVFDYSVASGPNNNPGPSGLDASRQVTSTIQSENVYSAISFENKMLSLKKMEQRTARQFQQHGIENEFEWPTENESKDEAYVRKLQNANRLHAARQRRYQNPAHDQLSQQRHKKDAEKHKRYRNPDDEALRQQRHEVHAEEQRRYRNPDDGSLSQQRHEVHAEEQRRYRNPDDEALSQQRHEAHAQDQRSYRNPDDEALSQERHEAEIYRDHERRLPGQVEKLKISRNSRTSTSKNATRI